MDRKKTCNCLNDCPCYPNCDQMMSEGQMAGVPESAWRMSPDTAMKKRIWESENSLMRRTGETLFDEGMARSDLEEARRKPLRRGALTAEEENERDLQKLKEMYPDRARRLLAEVEDICDSMEYEGSVMFDDTPDRTRVRGMAERICGRVSDGCAAGESAEQNDMIQVLLYQEMFHRRCRRRGCRRG